MGVTTYGKRSVAKTLASSFFPRRSLRSRLLAAASLSKNSPPRVRRCRSALRGSAASRFP